MFSVRASALLNRCFDASTTPETAVPARSTTFPLTATSLSGVGFTNGAPWVAAGPRVGVEVEVSPRVALRAWAEVLADLTRNSLWFGGRDVYDLGPVSGGGGVAVAYHFL